MCYYHTSGFVNNLKSIDNNFGVKVYIESSAFSSIIIRLVNPATILSIYSVPIHLNNSFKYSNHISAVSYISISSEIILDFLN